MFPEVVSDPTDPGFNSYADLLEATALLNSRVGASGWEDVDEEDQARALVTATRDIDAIEGTDYRFIGRKADSAQALEWPRSGTATASNELPGRLVQATIELAFVYAIQAEAAAEANASLDVLNPETDRLKRKKIGPIEKEYFAPATSQPMALERFPAIVQRLLASLVRTTTMNAWGSALATRGS